MRANPGRHQPIDWRPQMMRDQAEFIRHLSTPEDKAAINSHIRNIVAGFFLQGIVSVRTLPNVSALQNGADALPSDPPRRRTRRRVRGMGNNGAELADYRVDDFAAVTRWPMREALISYRARMMQSAREAYRTTWPSGPRSLRTPVRKATRRNRPRSCARS